MRPAATPPGLTEGQGSRADDLPNPDEFGGETFLAPAKVNLCLRVVGRRSDGYHLLDSLVVFAGVGDFVSLEPAESLTLAVTGPFGGLLPDDGSNLILRAARLLSETTGSQSGARLRLDKQLPVAAGLGGGSSDAAAVLLALDRLWGCGLGAEGLQGLGAALGADLPVCLRGVPSRVGGFGEVLAPAPDLPPLWLLLINPGVELATAAVFQAHQGDVSPKLVWPEGFADAAALVDWLAQAGNDLETPARGLRPQIDAVLAALAAVPGCLLARMSGSGATCFGLCAEGAAAERAAAGLAAAHPAWWVRAAPVLRAPPSASDASAARVAAREANR